MSGDVKPATRLLEPEELILLGYYRRALRDDGPEGGERVVAAIEAALAALARLPVKRRKPTLAFSADRTVRS